MMLGRPQITPPSGEPLHGLNGRPQWGAVQLPHYTLRLLAATVVLQWDEKLRSYGTEIVRHTFDEFVAFSLERLRVRLHLFIHGR